MEYAILMVERRGAASLRDAELIVGGPKILELMRTAEWLAPKVQGNRLTLFDCDECVLAWKRLCAEGVDSLKQAAAEAKKSEVG